MSKRVVLELTNRCNLRCAHCFSGRHGGRNELSMEVIEKILEGAKQHGFSSASFTGGEPTLHSRFAEIVQRTAQAGYKFGFVSNGWNFATTLPKISPYRHRLSSVTFSLDGASEGVHDALRGEGSYRRVMRAIARCMGEGIPFAINMVITAHNRDEVEEMAKLAGKLGALGLRFGHLMPSPSTTSRGWDLSPAERRAVEEEIHQLVMEYPVRIAMAPGYHTEDLFPCAPLNLEEFNVDYRGYMSTCCHLSGQETAQVGFDVTGDLNRESFDEAFSALERENKTFRRRKRVHASFGTMKSTDLFPCWYCSLYYRKVNWLRAFKNHSWSDAMWSPDERNPEWTMSGKTNHE